MTAQDLTADSITAGLTSDVEGRLAAVRDRIGALKATLNELQDSETVLVNVLATLTSGVSHIPEQRTQANAGAPAPASTRQSDGLPAEGAPVGSARSAGPSATDRHPTRRKAVKKARAAAAPQGGKVSKNSAVGTVTLPERVRDFLRTNPGPQKTGEIAQALFGADATPAHGNQVRAAAEALARRGEVEKDRQGQSVFYQTVTSTLEEPAQVAAAEAASVDEG